MQKISFISNKNMATIIRQSYIDKIEKYLGKEAIIVLVGQRRVIQVNEIMLKPNDRLC